jgi:hypothetical protein
MSNECGPNKVFESPMVLVPSKDEKVGTNLRTAAQWDGGIALPGFLV